LAFDHPVLSHQGVEQRIHGLGVPDPGELTALVTRAQTADEVAAEVARERPHLAWGHASGMALFIVSSARAISRLTRDTDNPNSRAIALMLRALSV